MPSLDRRTFLKGIAGSTVALGAMGTATAADGRDQFLVTGSGNGVRKRLEREGYEVVASVADGAVNLVVGGSRSDIEGVGGVRSAAPNERYRLLGPAREVTDTDESTDDQYTDRQWDKMADTTGAFEAHDAATGAGRRVAIIDTGIETSHPDLNTATADGRLFRADGASSPDGSLTVDGDTTIEARLPPASEAVAAYTYRGEPETKPRAAADDVHSHGTHCAGIATANDEGTTGIAGMAPDADAVPLRVFYWKRIDDYVHEKDNGEEEEITVTALTTTDFDILSAIDYAPEVDADAANMSLGGGVLKGSERSSGEHVAYQRVVQSAVKRGTVVTASAGNASSNLQQGGYYTLPNSVPGTVSVTATGPNNERAYYSNYGTSDVDVGAPGGGYETPEKTESGDTELPYPQNLVYSTVPADLNGGTEYAWFAGTSMAAPQVAGVVALVRDVAPDLNAKQVQNVIERTARFSDGKSSPDVGAGVVYAPDAVERASRFSGD